VRQIDAGEAGTASDHLALRRVFLSNPFDIGRTALSQFRVMVRIPCAGEKFEGLTLFVAPDIPP
jgi:hypothetical protein